MVLAGHLNAESAPPLASGLVGSRYAVGALLGQGSGGEVYQGFDRALRRDVAIKVLRGSAGLDQAARFEREVHLLARLQHPHLVPLYDAALDDGRRYLVMPLVRGANFAERIAAGPVPDDEVGRVGTALAGALAYLHVRGIVHRDVKPSNVLLGDNGQVFLADFGVARAGEADQTLTAPGRLTGTAAYLAPEQVEGDTTGPGCDVYALGLVLLEALTGVRAYRGTVLEQALARLWRQPEIPLSLGADRVRLLDAMTARDPARRPAAASVAGLLRRDRDLNSPATATVAFPAVTGAIHPAVQSPSRRWRASAAGRVRPAPAAVDAWLQINSLSAQSAGGEAGGRRERYASRPNSASALGDAGRRRAVGPKLGPPPRC